MIKNILLTLIFILTLFLSKFLLTLNYIFVFKWWLTLFVLGIIFLPLTTLIFNKLKGVQCFTSKLIGFALSSITFYFLSYAKILKYTPFNCWLVIFIFALINIFILIKTKKYKNIFNKHKLTEFLTSEIIFLVIFIIWSYIRCFSPEIKFDTEKFMNYGFLNSLFNTAYLPAQDMWLYGYYINYYYFGHYIASFLTKISFSNIAEGFNLSVVTINTFSFIMPLTIGFNLGIHLIKKSKNKLSKLIPHIIATLCAISVCLGGSLYYPIYNFIIERDTPYYYWEDSRFIGYRPETNDKTINETLPYSNVLGDLHAHHIDTMFVFLTLAILLNLLLDSRKKNLKSNLLHSNIILLGIILGIEKMTNFWDFPIYLTVITLVLIFNNIIKYKLNKKSILLTLSQIIEIIIISLIVSLPFTLDFYMCTTEIRLTHITSPLYKMLVYWGLPTFCVLLYILTLVIDFITGKEKGTLCTKIFKYLHKLNKTDLFIFIIGCCAIGLIIIPEIIYIKDIYGDEFKRANTVYKLCYQADIMFDISVSYILIRLLYAKKHIVAKILTVPLLIAFISTFGYGINAINYATNSFNREKVKSLAETESYIEKYYPARYNALQWIKENINRNEIVLEKSSGSYKINCYTAIFAGNPTILGWHGHEWLWRADKNYSSPEVVKERWNDVNAIYSSTSKKKLQSLLNKYNISYMLVSSNDTKNLKTLQKIGKIVFERKDSKEIIYIIEVEQV